MPSRHDLFVGAVVALGIAAMILAMRAAPPPWMR